MFSYLTMYLASNDVNRVREKEVCFPEEIILSCGRVLEVSLVQTSHHTVLVAVDERSSDILVRSQVGIRLRDGHSYRPPTIGCGTGEVGEKPSVNEMNLRGPHVVLAPHGPPSGREHIALQVLS